MDGQSGESLSSCEFNCLKMSEQVSSCSISVKWSPARSPNVRLWRASVHGSVDWGDTGGVNSSGGGSICSTETIDVMYRKTLHGCGRWLSWS